MSPKVQLPSPRGRKSTLPLSKTAAGVIVTFVKAPSFVRIVKKSYSTNKARCAKYGLRRQRTDENNSPFETDKRCCVLGGGEGGICTSRWRERTGGLCNHRMEVIIRSWARRESGNSCTPCIHRPPLLYYRERRERVYSARRIVKSRWNFTYTVNSTFTRTTGK